MHAELCEGGYIAAYARAAWETVQATVCELGSRASDPSCVTQGVTHFVCKVPHYLPKDDTSSLS